MKNEAPYVLEWLAHYRAIGATDFLIYTNDCSDGTDLLLERLDKNGFVNHRRNRVLKRGPHKSALKHAMADPVYQNADWVFVCDADEFLCVHLGEGRFGDLIAAYPDADAIPVPWRMFSNSGRTEMTRTICADLFECEPDSGEAPKPAFVKTLFRQSESVARLGLHGPVFDEGAPVVWRSAHLDSHPESNPLRPSGRGIWRDAQVNHYAVRTVDSFIMKRDRGRANHVGGELELDYWRRWNRGGTTDRSVLRYKTAVAALMDEYHKDPIVTHIDEGAWEWHRKRLHDLLQDPETKRLREALKSEANASPRNPARASAQALRIKAPKRHANRLEMLSRMPKQGRCAEIGVWNGAFSAEILEVTRPRELVLIDPWDLLAASDKVDWNHPKHGDAAAMEEMYDQVRRMYAEAPEVVLRKGFSEDVLASYPDDYFDWVYIDGNHQYEFVRRDLELAFAKVRDGGIVAGDDFFWKRDGRMHVREAVIDVMRERGMTGRPQRIGQQFMLEVRKGR